MIPVPTSRAAASSSEVRYEQATAAITLEVFGGISRTHPRYCFRAVGDACSSWLVEDREGLLKGVGLLSVVCVCTAHESKRYLWGFRGIYAEE